MQESTRGFQSEYAHINGCILESHSSAYLRVTAQSTHMPVQQQFLQSFKTVQHNHRSQAATSIRPEQTFQRFADDRFWPRLISAAQSVSFDGSRLAHQSWHVVNLDSECQVLAALLLISVLRAMRRPQTFRCMVPTRRSNCGNICHKNMSNRRNE